MPNTPHAHRHGFEEIPHTADWAMRVWAEDLPSLFAEAARGMNALAGAQISNDRSVKRTFEAEAPDAEGLLVAFLSELVYLQEQENMGFSHFAVETSTPHLVIDMEGGPLAALEKPIKAVTYHNLKVSPTTGGYEVMIVFDV